MISIWEKETFFAPQDVIIVGSGLAGLWSAWHLKEKNRKLKITIIDRGVIPTGASTRNAGFACFGSLSELVYDAAAMGTDKMLKLVEMRYKGLEEMQKLFKKKEIDFSLCGGYELYDEGLNKNVKSLKEQINYLNLLLKPITGSKKTFCLANEAIPKFGFGKTQHLVENRLEGYLHSGKLVQCLLRKVQGDGVQVLNGIEIKGFEQQAEQINLTSTHSFQLQAKQLLICTNAFAKELLPQEDIVPARGQVLLTSPIKNLPFAGTFHSDEGFYYFRNLGKRVLLGGARNKAFDDERTSHFAISPVIQDELERYLREVVLPRFSNQYTIEHRWAGIMGMGGEKMPIIKEVQPNIFCAVRMSGMGVALAPIVGQQVATMMQ
ncbi:MAG: FAD-binding oxidoreductase [Bacteroidota bacterium]|nr:FAD-binding oxidoreductase [Flavisolibacter sp.]MBD0349819.1 FAD-binding oxidoreductase [Flavisolibacter sp.]MBD0365113.1 FAD-binding oxidoreductase [Flavisolibacter sp.]MDQ3842961.1 FAD-binding oxidoreductase [Bacteroidota bacterium]